MRCLSLKKFGIRSHSVRQTDCKGLRISPSKKRDTERSRNFWACRPCIANLIGAQGQSKWYSISMNLENVCCCGPQRELTRCLISTKPAGDQCQRKCQHAPPKPCGHSLMQPNLCGWLSGGQGEAGFSHFTLASTPVQLNSQPASSSCYTSVITVHFCPFPSC